MTNARLRSAITTVSAQNFANGRVAHNLQPVNIDMLQQGRLMQGTLPVTPTKASLQPLNRPVNRAALPAAAADDQHFVTRNAGPNVQPRPMTPAPQANPGSWQRFGSKPGHANPGAGSAPTQSQGGWKRFEPRPSGGSPAPRGGEYRL
jgi:hypothetical protein